MDSTNVRTPLLTAKEVAAILGCSVFSVAKWAQKGDLPTAWKGDGVRGQRLFDPKDVETFRAARNGDAS